jgi:hypothetical protein
MEHFPILGQANFLPTLLGFFVQLPEDRCIYPLLLSKQLEMIYGIDVCCASFHKEFPVAM